MMSVIEKAKKVFVHGGFVYSAMFGAACGIAGFAALVQYRAFKLYFSDIEYCRVNSRRFYLEKQTIFNNSLDEQLRGQRLAAMVQEYVPFDARQPFSELDPKYRI